MIDHTGFLVTDTARSTEFYTKALAPLGYELLKSFGPVRGFGEKGHADFWLNEGTPTDKVHLGFRAASRATVKAFYEAAIAAGGTDNGAPGPRDYHPGYYGAFVLDPDGNNVEAVWHGPTRRSADSVRIERE